MLVFQRATDIGSWNLLQHPDPEVGEQHHHYCSELRNATAGIPYWSSLPNQHPGPIADGQPQRCLWNMQHPNGVCPSLSLVSKVSKLAPRSKRKRTASKLCAKCEGVSPLSFLASTSAPRSKSKRAASNFPSTRATYHRHCSLLPWTRSI